MNKQYLLIILIISLGITGIAYASNADQVTTSYIVNPQLNVTTINLSGSCNGCSITENSYSHYNTVFLNSTFTIPTQGLAFQNLSINDNGYVLGICFKTTVFVSPTGVLIQSPPSQGSSFAYQVGSQSVTGEYQVIDNNGDTGYIVYKNGSLLQTLGLKYANFSAGNALSVAISPNGQYIVVIGQDASGSGTVREVIFKGS